MKQFAFALWNNLSRGANILISPASVYAVLLRSALGAQGSTRTELLDVLQIPDYMSNEELLLLGRTLEEFMTNNDITVANGMFVETSIQLKADFMAGLSEDEIRRLPFASDPESACKEINNWVAEQTQQRVLDLLGEGTINNLTALVLVNALYLNASWRFAFNEEETMIDHFYSEARKNVQVEMMMRKGNFPYLETDHFQAVQLPYAETEMFRLYVLPKDGVSLELVSREIAFLGLNLLVNSMDATELTVLVPKFEMGWGTENLRPALEAMGIKQAFVPDANFSGIFDGPLYISGIHQKTWMEDTEKGSEMAAATAAVFTLELASNNVVQTFRANRPFLFFNLVPTSKGYMPVFMGQLVDPSLL